MVKTRPAMAGGGGWAQEEENEHPRGTKTGPGLTASKEGGPSVLQVPELNLAITQTALEMILPETS